MNKTDWFIVSETKRKIHIPLVLKIVVLTSILIISVATVLAYKNAELFTQISKDREEASADALTSSKSLEVEAILESYVEKLTSLSAEKSAGSVSGDLVFFKLASDKEEDQFESSTAGMTDDLKTKFHQVITEFKSQEVGIRNGKLVITSSGADLREPFLLLGTPVVKDNGVVTHWAWGFFKLNRLQASFESRSGFKVYLIDNRGHVIVHPDEKMTLAATNLSQKKMISALIKEELRRKQQYSNDTLYSAAKTAYGPMVIGEVAQASILAPAKLVKETSTFILGLVLSISFFLSFLFSQSLSKNLEALTGFAHRIAQGDFNVEVSKEIRSRDEVGILAVAFDDMTVGLRERDKIKNMFTKFHGTEITEQLMNQEDMRKGKECEAVVFFSDIRGFTDFSNDRSAEEVVEMLNSYFEVMVMIINKHGGVVDKFVGDAIMAIWGAPTGTEDDAKKAVAACLDMRMALELFNDERLRQGLVPIKIGMGLHAGPVVAGTVGSNDRLEYTVIGDTVNIASRIESATKSYGTDLLISEEVLKLLDDEFLVIKAGVTKVKGKDKPLKLARVTGRYDSHGNPQIYATPYSQYDVEEDEKVELIA